MLLVLLGAEEFWFEGQKFMLGKEEFVIQGGTVQYLRVPRYLWEHRIMMAAAMGVNTISTDIVWNAHERPDGTLDFESEQLNIKLFAETVQKHGLKLIVRVGPFLDSALDLGGQPARFLYNATTCRRTFSDKYFYEAFAYFIKTVAQILIPLQNSQEGPIIMIGIDDSFSFVEGQEKEYIPTIAYLLRYNGLNGPFFTADYADRLTYASHLQGGAIGLIGSSVTGKDFELARELDPNVPAFAVRLTSCSFSHWGKGEALSEAYDLSEIISEYIQNRTSFIIDPLLGGSNFGFIAGSEYKNGRLREFSTSYAAASPITEQGRPGEYYYKYRALMQGDRPTPLPAVPDPLPTMYTEHIKLDRVGTVFDQNFVNYGYSYDPLPFEYYMQDQGVGIYTVHVPGGQITIELEHAHDYLQFYVDKKCVKSLYNDQNGPVKVVLNLERPAPLEIVVFATGHLQQNGAAIDERKGIFGSALINGYPLRDWELRLLSLKEFPENMVHEKKYNETLGGVLYYPLELEKAEDTYLDFENGGRGFVVVNGHNLGAYQSTGPQRRIFCPGAWLKVGYNEFFAFDTEETDWFWVIGYELPEGCPEGKKPSPIGCIE